VNPTRTNPDPGYFPISERMAGWFIGLVILADVLIIAGVGFGFMWLVGALG